MPFHRYKTPAYNLLGGAFPGTVGDQTYDLVNVVSEGVGGGDGSANADGAKASPHANAGTYFVAFGEDATSSFANRGLRAISQNTDAIDDILRGNIPRVDRVAITQSMGSIDVVVTGDVFVGEYGLTNTQEHRDRLAHLEFATGTPLNQSSGDQPTLLLIHDGSGNNVVGTAVDGFRNGAVLRFSAMITSGSYTAFVGRRTSYADIFEARMSEMVAEHLLGRHMDAELWKNFSHGLNEKYRKSTHRVGGTTSDLNVPGSGAVIYRDGKALTIISATKDWEGAPASTDDPMRAGITLSDVDTPWGNYPASSYDASQSGNVGIVSYQTRKTVEGTPERGPYGRDAATLLVVNPVDMTANNASGDPYFTYTRGRIPATLNPDGTGADRLHIDSPYYFRTGGNTGLALCHDIALVTRTIGSETVSMPYLIYSIVDDNTITLVPLGSDFKDDPASFPANTIATFTWLQVCEVVAGANGGTGWHPGQTAGDYWSRFMSYSHTRSRAGSAANGRRWRGMSLYGGGPSNKKEEAILVGYHSPASGVPSTAYRLSTRGAAQHYEGFVHAVHVHRPRRVDLNGTSSTTIDVNPLTGAGLVSIVCVNGGTKTITFQETSVDNHEVGPGMVFYFTIYADSSDITLVTPSNWLFSNNDKVLPSQESGRAYKFEVLYAFESYGGGGWKAYVTRTDYEDT
jgi:hypothetical protein